MKKCQLLCVIVGLLLGGTAVADKIPQGALPLSDIVKGLESAGFGQIEYIRMQKKRWKIKVRQDGKLVEFRIDPLTAEVVSQK